jgi:5-histidylcysteine sulfoxide synthase/putative 4-mercaptohistidine N1-methyltranferase
VRAPRERNVAAKELAITDSLKWETLWGGFGGGETRRTALFSPGPWTVMSEKTMNERSKTGWRTDPRLQQTRTIVLNSGTPKAKRAEIRDYFHATYEIDAALLEILRYDESFYYRADPLRHPLIFYFGHTATFYMNKLLLAKLVQQRVNPAYESIFAVGVDEMSWDDLNEAHYDWPAVADVQAYRDRVRDVVDNVIQTLPLDLPVTWDSPWWVIMMGIEHARIHLETSSVLIRQLPIEHVRPHPLWRICPESGVAPANELVDVPAGKVVLGKTKDHPLYGWDNEFGHFAEAVKGHRASRYLVTNSEFRGFVEDGGYRQERWWTDEGWRWRSYKQADQPLFWITTDGDYRLRTVAEEIEMPWDWPVEVNYLEAKAFCNWQTARMGATVRLPTEAEWYRLRDACVDTDQPDWDRAPGNINLEHAASSCPVTKFAFGDFCDVIGNVWQWTETPITGFDGFEVHPYYDDFSIPTFDGLHNLIKGGSWISTGNEATRDCRYAFRRHFFQHAGFRYVQSDEPVSVRVRTYETDQSVAQYCESHYGEDYFGVENFPKAISRICLELMADRPRVKALDLGCAVGRATFELARQFRDVMGLDYSARFIRVGVQLKEKGVVRYTCIEEGELVSYRQAKLADVDLDGTQSRVTFQQADACNLKPLYTGYDLVLATNLIDRLYNPRKFLSTIQERINRGGLLVIASPYSWDEAFTEKEQWLGGTRIAGEPVATRDGLHECLSPYFTPIGAPVSTPFVLRETKRKFQHSLSEVTVWERHG